MLKRPIKWLRGQELTDVVGVVLLAGLAFFLYVWRLNTLPKGFSPDEIAERAASSKLHIIWDNPLYVLHRIVEYIPQHFGLYGLFSMRFSSVLFSLLFVGCFYYIASSWYGKQMAFFSTLIFVSTPLFLITSRSATADIMYLWTVVVAASYTWLLHTKSKSKLAWLVFCAACAICLYIPGLIWFILAAALFVRKKLLLVAKNLPRKYSIGGLLLSLVIILPLVWAGIHHHQLAREVFGVPLAIPKIKEVALNIGWTGLSVVWQARAHTPLILGRLPLLDIFQVVLLIIGVFALWSRARQRVISVAGTLAVAIVVSGFYMTPSLLLAALPAICLIAGVGLRYLFVQWKERFPHNPLAHYFALTLICVVVIANLFVGMRYALIAWPHSVATSTLYVLK